MLDLDGLDLDTLIQPNEIPYKASSEAITTATEENSNILEEAIRQNNLQVTSNLEDFNEFLPNADNLSSNVPINTNEDMKPATFRAFVSQPIPKVLQYSETQKTFHIKSGGRFPLQMEAASKYKIKYFYKIYLFSTEAFFRSGIQRNTSDKVGAETNRTGV